MRNEQLITAYLDACAERLRTMRSDDIDERKRYGEMVRDGHAEQLWQQCLDDGWTAAELGAAYKHRFGRKVISEARDGESE